MENVLSENLAKINRRIEESARRVGRNSAEIKLVAVSKTHPISTIHEAIEAGATIFGENKVQEAEGKIFEIGGEKCEWHLIGKLQANKARKAVRLFDLVETLDSPELALRLDRICKEEGRNELSVLIQVDLAQEETKNGVDEGELPNLIKIVKQCKYLNLRGLMTIPPYFEDAQSVRPYFKKLRELRDKFLPKGELSMGMSHDFEIAIEEGATLVRVGTAIFGERNYQV